jgi:hypothetical protein
MTAETGDEVWDASAIVLLVMTDPTTKTVQALAEKDPAMLVWWGTEVECASAIAAPNATAPLMTRR